MVDLFCSDYCKGRFSADSATPMGKNALDAGSKNKKIMRDATMPENCRHSQEYKVAKKSPDNTFPVLI
ncbi:MAG: hypothetical protein Q8L69_01375 [Gallionellaceae bacterium]|nr:hypothetical protein [Gallionellaceae bacterium]